MTTPNPDKPLITYRCYLITFPYGKALDLTLTPLDWIEEDKKSNALRITFHDGRAMTVFLAHALSVEVQTIQREEPDPPTAETRSMR